MKPLSFIKISLAIAASVLIASCFAPPGKGTADGGKNDNAVIIRAWENYPIASGKLLETVDGELVPSNDDDKEIALPNGTMGVVVEWNEIYLEPSSLFAQMHMFNESKVRITSGPLKGKTLSIPHAYLNLAN